MIQAQGVGAIKLFCSREIFFECFPITFIDSIAKYFTSRNVLAYFSLSCFAHDVLFTLGVSVLKLFYFSA